MAIDYQRYRLTVDQYDQMIKTGIFGEDDRVELVEGELIQMSPIGDRHAELVDRLTNLFASLVARGFWISIQNPIRLDGESKPQPDVVLVRRPAGVRRPGRPTPKDIVLLIEVADDSLRFDHLAKGRLYARHGIPEYWVVDVKHKPVALTVYQRPGPDGYQEQRLVKAGDPLSLVALPDVSIDTEELLDGW